MPHPNWSQSDEVTGVDFQPDRLVGERGECVDHDVTAELRLLIGHSHFDVAESLVLLCQPDGIHCFPFLVVEELSPSLHRTHSEGESVRCFSEFFGEWGDGDLSAHRSIMVRQDAREVIGMDGQPKPPRCSLRGDAPQEFLAVAGGEVSIHGSIPHREACDTEALIVLGEQVFGDVGEVLNHELPTIPIAIGSIEVFVALMIVDLAGTLVGVFGGVGSALGRDGHWLAFLVVGACGYKYTGWV